MKKIILSLFVIIAMTSLQANAFDFMSILRFWDKASEAQTTADAQKAKTLTDIQNQMTTIDNSVQNAFLEIVSDLSTWREGRSVKSELKSKSLVDVINEYATNIANNKNEFVKRVNKLSAKEKTELVNNLATLSDSAQQYLLLATDGVKAASNTLKTTQKLSEVATTLGNINTVANQLKTRATTVINLANQAKSIAQSAGLTVQ